MSTGRLHDSLKDWLRVLVHEVAVGLEIGCQGVGQTTWKRRELSRGLRSELCYYEYASSRAARRKV